LRWPSPSRSSDWRRKNARSTRDWARVRNRARSSNSAHGDRTLSTAPPRPRRVHQHGLPAIARNYDYDNDWNPLIRTFSQLVTVSWFDDTGRRQRGLTRSTCDLGARLEVQGAWAAMLPQSFRLLYAGVDQRQLEPNSSPIEDHPRDIPRKCLGSRLAYETFTSVLSSSCTRLSCSQASVQPARRSRYGSRSSVLGCARVCARLRCASWTSARSCSSPWRRTGRAQSEPLGMRKVAANDFLNVHAAELPIGHATTPAFERHAGRAGDLRKALRIYVLRTRR
jgi:hypothetical protein